MPPSSQRNRRLGGKVHEEFDLAVQVLGLAARAWLDRSMPGMAQALLAGNCVTYLPGLLWLGEILSILIRSGLREKVNGSARKAIDGILFDGVLIAAGGLRHAQHSCQRSTQG